MNVQEIMSQGVRTCSVDDQLTSAAQLMWDNDCGCVPVVEDDGKLAGMLTDRDVCMAAYTQGRSLSEIPVFFCHGVITGEHWPRRLARRGARPT